MEKKLYFTDEEIIQSKNIFIEETDRKFTHIYYSNLNDWIQCFAGDDLILEILLDLSDVSRLSTAFYLSAGSIFNSAWFDYKFYDEGRY